MKKISIPYTINQAPPGDLPVSGKQIHPTSLRVYFEPFLNCIKLNQTQNHDFKILTYFFNS